MISLLGLAIANAPVGAADAVSTMRACDNHPVLMVVAGPTRDRARMIAYAQAIAKKSQPASSSEVQPRIASPRGDRLGGCGSRIRVA